MGSRFFPGSKTIPAAQKGRGFFVEQGRAPFGAEASLKKSNSLYRRAESEARHKTDTKLYRFFSLQGVDFFI